MSVRGEHYEMHPDSLRRKVLYEIKTQKKSIAIIAELNGLPNTTVWTWAKQAGLDRGRPAYRTRAQNRKANQKRPSDDELGVINFLLRTWRLK